MDVYHIHRSLWSLSMLLFELPKVWTQYQCNIKNFDVTIEWSRESRKIKQGRINSQHQGCKFFKSSFLLMLNENLNYCIGAFFRTESLQKIIKTLLVSSEQIICCEEFQGYPYRIIPTTTYIQKPNGSWSHNLTFHHALVRGRDISWSTAYSTT